jgi:hypothetical protein
MTTSRPSGRTPVERVHDHARILKAMTAAVREAVRQHKRLGYPVAVWREGRVVWLTADEIPEEPEYPDPGGA